MQVRFTILHKITEEKAETLFTSVNSVIISLSPSHMASAHIHSGDTCLRAAVVNCRDCAGESYFTQFLIITEERISTAVLEPVTC